MCSLQPILGDFEPGHGLQTQRPTAWSVHKGVEVRSGWQPFTNPKQTSVQCRFANYVFSCSSFCSYTFCRSDQLPQRDHLRLLTAWPRPRSEGAVGTQPALRSKLIAEAGGWRGTMARTLRWLELCLGQIGHGLPKNGCPTFCKHTLLRWNHVIINPYRSFWDIDYIIMITVIITFKYTTKPPCCGKDQTVFLAFDEKKQDSC